MKILDTIAHIQPVFRMSKRSTLTKEGRKRPSAGAQLDEDHRPGPLVASTYEVARMLALKTPSMLRTCRTKIIPMIGLSTDMTSFVMPQVTACKILLSCASPSFQKALRTGSSFTERN
jgi:hypothetical protein